MVEAPKIYFSRPPLLLEGQRHEVFENTVVVIPDLPEDFNFTDFKVEISPIGDVVILPVFPLDGHDLEDEDLEGAFLGGYLGLYTPQRREGDQFLVEISQGLKTSDPRCSTILMQFQEGKWKRSDFQLPLTVQPGK